MIFSIWTRLFLIVFFVTVPLTIVQYYLQRDSIELALEMAEKTTPIHLMDAHLQHLKQLSRHDPKNMEIYRREFEEIAELKIAREDLILVKTNLVKNLLKQTLRNVVIILLLFFAVSFFISKKIVDSFQNLLKQIQLQSKRLERLNSIESWQKVARVLVHELRAPITPIKLVSTDIETKYEQLAPSDFRAYLNEGAGLIRDQVIAVERLLESFTHFAKLPEVKKSQQSILRVLHIFESAYAGFNQGQVELKTKVENLVREEIWIDAVALKHLFFNLLKNAAEANPDEKISVEFCLRQDQKKTWIRIQNTGKEIPQEVSDKLFDLHISTKADSENSNFGIGLTVSKKIALDHGGDLYLVSSAEGLVVFELELPNL